jgi:hypothetical protein
MIDQFEVKFNYKTSKSYTRKHFIPMSLTNQSEIIQAMQCSYWKTHEQPKVHGGLTI